MWASSNCSLVRESTARAPSAIAASKPCGVSCVGAEIEVTSGPWLSETMWATLGGLAPIVATASSTNSASLAKLSARLWRRSKPIVEQVLRSIPELPQSEPPRCPGQTSVSSGSASSRSCRERKISAAPSRGSIARSGRATSPTKRQSPLSTAQGSPPRAASRSRKEVCSGRWPGVWIASMLTPSPSSSVQPSPKASCG